MTSRPAIGSWQDTLYRYPMLWIAVAIAIGIIVGRIINLPLVLLIAAMIGSIAGMYLLRKTYFHTALAAVFFISLGILLTNHRLKQQTIAFVEEPATYQLHISDYPTIKPNTVNLEARLIDNGTAHLIRLSMPRDSMSMQLTLGDIIIAHGKLSFPTTNNPLGFDYGRYLISQGYSATLYSYQWKKIGYSKIHTLRSWGRTQQKRIVDWYQRCGIHGRELGVISALTIGDRDLLDADTRQSFSAAGAMHILAVSGLHVGLIYVIILLFVTIGYRVKPLRKQVGWQLAQSSLIIALLWAYAIITGLSPSVVRATLMLSLAEIGRAMHRTDFGLNIVGLSAVIILLFKPLSLFTISFQLSYCAVISIMTYGQKWNRWATSWIHMTKTDSRLLRKVKQLTRYIIGIITISFAAQIGTLPLGIYYFNQMSTYFWLTNLFLIPYTQYVAIPSIIFTCCCPIIPQTVFSVLCDYIVWIEQLPYSTIKLWFDLTQTVLIFGILIAAYKPKYHTIAACLVVLFIAYYAYIQNENRQRDEIIVYSDRKANTIQIINQTKQSVLFTDSLQALATTENISLCYHLQQPQMQVMPYAINIDGIGRIVIVTDSVLQDKVSADTLQCNWLIAGDVGRISAKRFMTMIQPEKVILLATMKRYKREQFIAYCKENDIDYYDASENGAFIYTLR